MHSDFYRINVAISWRPGAYRLSGWKRRTQGASRLLAIVQENIDLDRSSHEILERLVLEIRKKFPEVMKCSVSVSPDLRKTFDVPALKDASVRYSSSDSVDTMVLPLDQVTTETNWERHPNHHLGSRAFMEIVTNETVNPKFGQFEYAPVKTTESPQTKGIRSQSQDLTMSHPSFATHHVIGESFLNHPGDLSEDRALQLCELGFVTADQYFPKNQVRYIMIRFTYRDERGSPRKIKSSVVVTRELYEQRKTMATANADLWRADHVAYIALGSNMGNRISMIDLACKEMSSRGLNVARISHLYETKPMYVENQQSFINGACEVRGPQRYTRQALTNLNSRPRPGSAQISCLIL